jgi:transposase
MAAAKRITRTYTPEFKHEAVRLTQQPDQTVNGVARDLGIPLSVLQGWRRQAKGNTPRASTPPGEADARIRQLERDLEIARQERDILKKQWLLLALKAAPSGLGRFAKESK